MPIYQVVITGVGIALLVITAAGLLVRRRAAFCRFFCADLLASAMSALLVVLWPSRFYNFTFYTVKETVLNPLDIAVALEVWRRSFSCFPKARRDVGVLLLGALVVTAIATWTIPGDLHPYDALVCVLIPRLHAGTISLFAILAAAAKWYGVPLHPLHRAILAGGAAALSVDVLLLSFLGWQSGSEGVRSVASSLHSVTYVGVAAWWTWAAWRPLRAPMPIVSRLQPWAHTW